MKEAPLPIVREVIATLNALARGEVTKFEVVSTRSGITVVKTTSTQYKALT